MSFISILRKVGSIALGIEHVAGPLISTFVPGAGPVLAIVDNIATRLQGSIVNAEVGDPRDGQGGLKEAVVVSDFEAGLDLTQSVLAINHQKLSYDQALLKTAIASQVAAYNALAKLKASFKIEPLA